MGQKINPNIIRLGVFKDWNSKFFELNKEKSYCNVFQNSFLCSQYELGWFFDNLTWKKNEWALLMLKLYDIVRSSDLT